MLFCKNLLVLVVAVLCCQNVLQDLLVAELLRCCYISTKFNVSVTNASSHSDCRQCRLNNAHLACFQFANTSYSGDLFSQLTQ